MFRVLWCDYPAIYIPCLVCCNVTKKGSTFHVSHVVVCDYLVIYIPCLVCCNVTKKGSTFHVSCGGV
jgi:hypothetical protein